MEAGYKKDLRHNYLVLEDNNDQKLEPFSLKMLEKQEIKGMLPVELKIMDNRALFYYEITSKQALMNMLEKASLSYDKLTALCNGIIKTIEKAYEYLLPEDDFVLAQEYIYVDIASFIPSLCYFPGYQKDVKEQLTGLFEYLMNKVDYNDKDAVFLVYQLYAVSKEEGYTLDHLKEALQEKRDKNAVKESTEKQYYQDKIQKNSGGKQTDQPEEKIETYEKGIKQRNVSNKEATNPKPSSILMKSPAKDKDTNDFPVVMEKIEGEVEATCYSVKALCYSALCILGGILTIILSIVTKIIFNTFGNRIDYSKLFALLLIIFCVEGYLLKKLLDKKNKITKMVKTNEYIDPREDYGPGSSQKDKRIRNTDQNFTPIPLIKELINHRKENTDELQLMVKPFTTDKDINGKTKEGVAADKQTAHEEEVYTPTCLLNSVSEKESIPVLKALDEESYKNIRLVSFPFFIGKLRKNVDYCLEDNVVSRYHAKVSKENGLYFLTDLNSTNGTYINQELLQTYKKKEIKSGDEIAFANIKYKFILRG
jgi:hypothetical protein